MMKVVINMVREIREEKKIKKNKYAKNRFPIFWKECYCCGKEVKFEWVWKWIKYHQSSPLVTWSEKFYLCKRCVESRREATEYFQNNIGGDIYHY